MNRNPDGDVAAELLERRWFAAFKAASSVRTECEELLDAMERIESQWQQTRARLSEVEALRDALGQELVELDHPQSDLAPRPRLAAIERSAA
jgi:chromosome segregation ATPase